MNLELKFLGAAGTVTGSRHLLSDGETTIMLDCGMFQGLKNLRQRNWAPFPVEPAGIDAILLSHAHLDHSGYLPRLVREGFKGNVYASAATIDLARILLADSAHLQESDADFANRHGLTRHTPALPLYTVADAKRAMERFKSVEFAAPYEVAPGVHARFSRAGHILGASIVEIDWRSTRIVFSGDLGRYGDPLLPDPEPIRQADYLLLESTYGDRRHEAVDPMDQLADIIDRTAQRGGSVIIPAFAVGRAQLLLWYLYMLKKDGRLPAGMPIYLDSPMSVNAVEIYRRHCDLIRPDIRACDEAYGVAHYVRDAEESKKLDLTPMPKVIISASGMATGGRVLHHLKRYAPDPRSTILFSGYQAAGTRGAKMLHGADTIKIHGEYVPVRAELSNLSMLSAHADSDELMRWLRGFKKPPRTTFLVHGEPEAADTLRLRIQDELDWSSRVVEHLETVRL